MFVGGVFLGREWGSFYRDRVIGGLSEVFLRYLEKSFIEYTAGDLHDVFYVILSACCIIFCHLSTKLHRALL